MHRSALGLRWAAAEYAGNRNPTHPTERPIMNTPCALNVFQRSIAFCLAAIVTFSLLGGIDQLAQQPPAADGWATHASSIPQA